MNAGDVMERLQKVIAASGYCSRRKAEELIKNGHVTVNGSIVTELGTKVLPTAKIEIDGEKINKEHKEYYLLYKPRSVITSTSDDKHRKTVVELIETDARIYPVGRLDYDTTGVLILTNDGDFANMLMHPTNKIDKVYLAKVKGILYPDMIRELQRGIMIDGKKTARSKVHVKKYDKKSDTSMVEVIIHEGKNHQVKKMFEAVGKDVVKLHRERIAFLDLRGLKSGEYRRLNPKEIKQLYTMAEK